MRLTKFLGIFNFWVPDESHVTAVAQQRHTTENPVGRSVTHGELVWRHYETRVFYSVVLGMDSPLHQRCVTNGVVLVLVGNVRSRST